MTDAPARDLAARRSPQFAGSKFSPPTPSAVHVSRRHLSARLDGGWWALGLVVGSPGVGKTSLLGEWFRSRPGGSAAWLNVDHADQDPFRFWHGFLAAVAGVHAGFAEEGLDALTLSSRADHDFLETLLEAAARFDHELTVVVDDFHLAGAEVHDQIRFLLSRSPSRLRLVIGTRAEPGVGLQRLRLDGRLCELREVDLRFSEAEARQLFGLLDTSLSDEGFEGVWQRTEGWAAGLQLSAVALRVGADTDAFLDRLDRSSQVISQYLWSEVYDAQPAEVQRFLTDTCVVDELSTSLASALSPGNPVTLLDVESANLLLQRLDRDGATFRYHHLLIDMLRAHLRLTDASHELVLQARAARWYADHGDGDAAFRHRWLAGQRTEALQSMHGTVLDTVYDTVPRLSEAERLLRAEDVLAAPGPALSFAIVLLTRGFADEARRLLRRIEMAAGAGLSAEERLQLLSARAVDALAMGDTHAAVRFGAELSTQRGGADLERWFVLGRCVMARAHVWQDELGPAAAVLDGLRTAHATDFEQIEVNATVAQLAWAAGRLSSSVAVAEGVLDDLDRAGPGAVADPTLTSAVLGSVLLDRGDLIAAQRSLAPVADTTRSFRTGAIVLAKVSLARLWIGEGSIDAARLVLDDAYGVVRAGPSRSGIRDHVRETHARLLIVTRELVAAAEVVAEMETGVRRALLDAEVAVEMGDGEAAGRILHRLEPVTTSARHALTHAMLRVRVDVAAGRDPSSAADAVLDVAEPEGFVFPLTEMGSVTLQAVQQQARRRTRTEFVDRVLRVRPRPAYGADRRYDALTVRERAVLPFLATSLSYSEIAETLFVSHATVKTHVRNICQKLQVSSRSAAVDRARRLRYL